MAAITWKKSPLKQSSCVWDTTHVKTQLEQIPTASACSQTQIQSDTDIQCSDACVKTKAVQSWTCQTQREALMT